MKVSNTRYLYSRPENSLSSITVLGIEEDGCHIDDSGNCWPSCGLQMHPLLLV